MIGALALVVALHGPELANIDLAGLETWTIRAVRGPKPPGKAKQQALHPLGMRDLQRGVCAAGRSSGLACKVESALPLAARRLLFPAVGAPSCAVSARAVRAARAAPPAQNLVLARHTLLDRRHYRHQAH